MPQQPSTFVVAAFITPKQTYEQRDTDLKRPTDETESHVGTFEAGKPPLAQPEPDLDEALNEKPQPGGLFLEEDDSKRDTIKRCPAQ